MNYYKAIKELYPNIKDDQFRIQDDNNGSGLYIAFWKYEQPKPQLSDIRNAAIYYMELDACYQNRILAYGPVGDQLDMIYQDQINNTTKWRDRITEVKQANPKPVRN